MIKNAGKAETGAMRRGGTKGQAGGRAKHGKKPKETFQAQDPQYRELVHNVNSIIYRRDPAGRITFFNEYAQAFFGYGEAEILGKHV
ncbi:MAG TPA: PAS domain-containing protein, partial [Syntrophales bacterium]|nr:PAS domain-containing protein [Syntrophales bacterium]